VDVDTVCGSLAAPWDNVLSWFEPFGSGLGGLFPCGSEPVKCLLGDLSWHVRKVATGRRLRGRYARNASRRGQFPRTAPHEGHVFAPLKRATASEPALSA
jgi:hypothetical protein